jgi:putative CocE/NonD family hydrolase
VTKTVTSFPRQVREIETLWIPLAGGVKLAARMWLPHDAEQRPVPAILEYLPYRRRDGTAVRDSHMHPYIAGHGYACMRVDMQGSGDSDGLLTDEYLPLELEDGVEVIAWLARQPWCSGTVGMIGNSWGGFNGLQIAALRPPALKAIITSCSTDDRYADDVHYMGGCLINDNQRWASTMLSHNSRPPDPTVVGERWRAMWFDRLENSGLWIRNWMEHPRRDAFWKHGSVCENYADIRCAVYAVGGWLDAYTNAIPRLMQHLTCPKKAMIGQWGHRFPHMALPGPPVGFLQEALRWWDKWLKGVETGVMDEPALRIWMQDSVPPKTFHRKMPGRWVAEPSWPPPSVTPTRLHFAPGRLSRSGGSAEALTIQSPQTLGWTFGKWCPYGLFPDLPSDQRDEDGGALVFETAPLDETVEVLGTPVVELELSSDKPQALVCARLSDVHPSGAATRVSYGLLNLTHRDSHEHPEPLTPGRSCKVRVKLNDLAQVFPKGHRIRIALSTTYWPLVWPSPEAATLTVHTGGSALVLPVRGASALDATLKPLPRHELPEVLKSTTVRAGRISQKLSKDRPTGALRYVFENDGGSTLLDGIDLTTSSWMRDTFSIHPEDPLSARGEVTSIAGYGRGDWQVETHGRTVLTATATSFEIEATLDAYEGGVRVFAKNWKVSIPRDNV